MELTFYIFYESLKMVLGTKFVCCQVMKNRYNLTTQQIIIYCSQLCYKKYAIFDNAKGL